jgi:ribose transport system substrate-binding protein
VRSREKTRLALMAVVGVTLLTAVTASAGGHAVQASGPFGENYNPKPAVLSKALGTTKTAGVPRPILAALYRAGLPVNSARLRLAMECWKKNTCDTGTDGELTVALADGFGENVWRAVTKMEFILQALTYPQIGKIIYTTARLDTQKAISDLRSLIAQDVDIIIGYPDAANALLPTVRQATQRGITYVPYAGGAIGSPGKDYLTYIGEDVCALGKTFARVLNAEVRSGNVAFLGGTPGNPLSATWQKCERPQLNKNIKVVGTADTNWTQEGAFKAVSGLISRYPDLKGISYEYADGFLGGVRAYRAANKPVNLVLTLRTDEVQLFCDWKKMKNPNFKIFYTSGGNFESRIALTAAMMKRSGASMPAQVVRPLQYRKVTASTCNPNIPGQASASSLIPGNVFSAMYPKR